MLEKSIAGAVKTKRLLTGSLKCFGAIPALNKAEIISGPSTRRGNPEAVKALDDDEPLIHPKSFHSHLSVVS
jgi:hypothetical protein